MNVKILMLPGSGLTRVTVTPGSTLADVAAAHKLQNRNLILNGVEVAPANWASTLVSDGCEIAAVMSTKGN